MHLGRVNISCLAISLFLFVLISKINSMHVSLSTRFNVISKIIKTIQTFITIKNMPLVESFF